MTRKLWQLGLLGVTFITVQYMLCITKCANVTKVPCSTINDSCIYNVNETVKNGYDVLWKPPNCTQWVCNASAGEFSVHGCGETAANHPYLALPMLDGDCYWPKCCNMTAHRECSNASAGA
uniref:Putative secreted salivary protein n=1 Tax=Rhipicephalus sanguineus TaxID=34632 RepID=C9W1Q8_RHISA